MLDYAVGYGTICSFYSLFDRGQEEQGERAASRAPGSNLGLIPLAKRPSPGHLPFLGLCFFICKRAKQNSIPRRVWRNYNFCI